MANSFFSFESGSAKSYYGKSGEIHKGGVEKLHGPEEDSGDFGIFCSNEEKMVDRQKGVFLSSDADMQQLSPHNLFPYPYFEDEDGAFQFDITTPAFLQEPEDSPTFDRALTELSDLIQPKSSDTQHYSTTIASLELLKGYKGRRYNKMNGKKINEHRPLVIQPSYAVDDSKRLSTEEVMRVAGAQYIQCSVPKDDSDLTMLLRPFGCAISGLAEEEIKDIELAHLLLASAEKIGKQQFDRGSKLLTQCANLSSDTGSPVQRVAYYFSEALQERIDRETGRFTSEGAKGREMHASDANVEETVLSLNPASLECYKALPFCQIAMFTGVQAIVESLTSAKKVHLIDLGLRTGLPWTMLMQALSSRKEPQVEMLKITAVGTKNQKEIQDAGRMLTSFAESMSFRFSFNGFMVPNLEDIKEELFELEEDESIAVYSAFVLRTMLRCSNSLDSLMTVIKNLNPCIMLVAEVEGNHNSPLFFSRFIESLFYFSAFFDCLETCMDRSNQNRTKIEAISFGQGILNIVATEGEERTVRNVGIDVWRSFFARFKMVETELSNSAMFQADSVKKQFAYGSYCTFDMNGKCLIVGWKGTPVVSLSAWTFL